MQPSGIFHDINDRQHDETAHDRAVQAMLASLITVDFPEAESAKPTIEEDTDAL